MAIIHILKDGSIVKDISGRIVRVNDARPVYDLINNINQNRVNKEVSKCVS